MAKASLLVAPGLFALKRQTAARLCLLLFVVFCAFFLPRLVFEVDITKSFSSDSRYARDYERTIAEFGFKPVDIIVLAQANKPFEKSDYAALQNLSLELELTDGVEFVGSIASARFSSRHRLFPDQALLLSEFETADLESRFAAYAETGLRLLISSDRTAALIIVSISPQIDGIELPAVVDDIKSVVNLHGGDGLRYSFAGEDLIGPELANALKRDLIVNNIAGCVIAIFVGLIVFRRWQLVLLCVTPSLLSAFIALCTFPLLGVTVSALNTVVPILILVLALADSVHLTLHFRAQNPLVEVTERTRKTLEEVGPACALTAITTAMAFLAISFTDSNQLQDLGLTGSVSVLLAYLIIIISFALLAPLLGRSNLQSPSGDVLIVPESLARWILSRERAVFFATAIVCILCLAGVSQLRPWFNLDENLPTNSSVRIANEKINQHFGGTYQIWSELDVSGKNTLDSQYGWNRLVKLTEALNKAVPDYPVISLATIAGWSGQPNEIPSAEILSELPHGLSRQLFDQQNNKARVISIVPEPMVSQASLQKQDTIELASKQAGAERVVGLPIHMRYESVSIIRQLTYGLLVACLISVSIIAWYYRRLALVLILLLPNILPLAVSAAALVIIKQGLLTPTSMLALTVAFGIAIDDSIHFINRYVVELKRGLTNYDALVSSITHAGTAMLATTVLISVGMAVTMTSAFETVRLFGGMLVLTFVTALFADLLLLPAILKLNRLHP